MSGSVASVVEELSIDTIQLAHTEGEIAIGGFDEEMIVVVHKTVSMAEPVIPLIDMLKRSEKVIAVVIVLEYGFLFIAARGHMINSTWIFYSKGPSHSMNITAGSDNVKSIDLTLYALRAAGAGDG